MELIISNASSKPIYEQITGQIKAMILSGELAEGEQLPSIRALANSLRVSAITTKRAYADLEPMASLRRSKQRKLRRRRQCGAHPRGAAAPGGGLMGQAVDAGRAMGLSKTELTEMFTLQLEDGD